MMGGNNKYSYNINTKIFFNIYVKPAELFLARVPVLTIVPSGSTTVRLRTFSLMDPYCTAVEPLHLIHRH